MKTNKLTIMAFVLLLVFCFNSTCWSGSLMWRRAPKTQTTTVPTPAADTTTPPPPTPAADITLPPPPAPTYTVCSSGCNSTTIQGIFNNNAVTGGSIVEVRADTAGGKKYYYETVTPGKDDSGSPDNHVIIRARKGDDIIINGGLTRTNGIVLTNVSYFTVDGFTISNHTGAAIYGKPFTTQTNWTIQNCIINIDLSTKVGLHNQGIGISGSSTAFLVKNVVIDKCIIQTGDGSLYEQTDGITLYYVDTATISNSFIDLRNANGCNYNTAGSNAACLACGAGDVSTCGYLHIDGIQTGSCKNLTIHTNRITLWRNHNNGAQGIYLEGLSAAGSGIDLGTWLVYNNILYADGWSSYGIALAQKNDTALMRVYNNTVVETYALAGSVPYLLTGANVYFKNNIGKTARANLVASFTNPTQIETRIDYNCYYNPGGSVVNLGGSVRTWDNHKATGYDEHSIFQAPPFNSNYELSAPLLSGPDWRNDF